MCRYLVWGLVLSYGAAVLLFLIGTFGLFGSERDPLAAVFLIPLGLPWNVLVDRLAGVSGPWLAGLAPMVNVVLLHWLCRAVGR